jgi:hypothetical protein
LLRNAAKFAKKPVAMALPVFVHFGCSDIIAVSL